MTGRDSTAARVRRTKDVYPEHYCANPRCLWRTYNANTGVHTPCPKHPERDLRGEMLYRQDARP